MQGEIKLHYVTLRSYCHKWYRGINRHWTRPGGQDRGVRHILRGRKKSTDRNIHSLSLVQTLTLTVTLSPNHFTTSNFGWPCTCTVPPNVYRANTMHVLYHCTHAQYNVWCMRLLPCTNLLFSFVLSKVMMSHENALYERYPQPNKRLPVAYSG